ncbi:MAG: hypothetical protein JWP89_5430 [Schlesneria sp.]|nr:hypothetical protein [Schlesneria sp.]
MRMNLAALVGVLIVHQTAMAEAPTANYIFPAGAQRGTSVAARVGGCNLHRSPQLIWTGSGVSAPGQLQPTETIWFEGPVIPQPASQQKEDYPRDFAAPLVVATDAPLGRQTWRLSTSQGVTTAWGFVVGTLPEVVEHELDGDAPPVRVDLPVTINGRIFPREDVDAWSFQAKAGQTIVCRVATSEFGSPLDARIELRSPDGRVLGEQLPEGNGTPILKVVTPVDGEYQIRIHDAAFGGLQDHVYRLTVTTGPLLEGAYPLGGRRGSATAFELQGANLAESRSTITLPTAGSEFTMRLPDQNGVGEVQLELGDLSEILEVEPNNNVPQPTSIPAVLNGRIQSPGDVDAWTFTAQKGIEYDFDVRAARLGSMLDAVLEVQDAIGKRLADADDSPGLQTDARLLWTAPADGEYRLAIKDRLASRGDARFAYRIRIVSSNQPEFMLTSTADTLIIERGKTVNLKVSLDRGPGFREPVELSLEGLPAGVTVASPAMPVVIAANQRELQLTLKAETDARIAVAPVKIIGRAKVGERELTAQTSFQPANPEPGRLALADGTGQCWIAVAILTPFKFAGIFETKFISRGSVFIRKYHIDRQGFEGPLEVQLADRQGRHLQGVTASHVVVPVGESNFEFAVTLPPWMEVGRTCRSTLAVTGQVTDADGQQYTVSYSSNDQHNQMIALVDPGRFAVQLPRTTLTAIPGEQVKMPIRIQRGSGLVQPITVELITSNGIEGVSGTTIEIPGDQSEGSLTMKFENTLSGLELRPVTIRAHTKDERGLPITAEASLTLVKAR